MYKYDIPTFIVRGEVVTDSQFSNEEYLKLLNPFSDKEFRSTGQIKSMVIQLGPPTKDRECLVYCYGETIDDLNSYPDGKMPPPVIQN